MEKISILLVGDDDRALKCLLYIAERNLPWYSIVSASGFANALWLCDIYRIDCVIIDSRMSTIDAMTAAKIIKIAYPRMPIILFSEERTKYFNSIHDDDIVYHLNKNDSENIDNIICDAIKYSCKYTNHHTADIPIYLHEMQLFSLPYYG